MKNLLPLLITFIINISLHSQTYENVKIIETTKVLNSTTNESLLGGVSRITIPINLPSNTVEWYYSFTTTPGSNGSSSINLLGQMGSLLGGGTPATAILSKIKIPQGSGAINAWLMTPESKYNFETQNDDQVLYYADLSETNTTQSIRKITNPIAGSFYLGLSNNSSYEAVSVTLEVIANIRKEATTNGWTKSTKQNMYNIVKQTLNTTFKDQIKQSHINSFSGCLMTKLTKDYTPNQLSSLAGYEFNNIFASYAETCSEELNIKFDDVLIPQKNINQEYFIGKWEDKNSTFTFSKYGIFTIVFDSGKIKIGNWKYINDRLELSFSSDEQVSKYIIAELTMQEMTYKKIDEDSVWVAKKIND